MYVFRSIYDVMYVCMYVCSSIYDSSERYDDNLEISDQGKFFSVGFG